MTRYPTLPPLAALTADNQRDAAVQLGHVLAVLPGDHPAVNAVRAVFGYPALPPLSALLVDDQRDAAAQLGRALMALPSAHPVVIAARLALELRDHYAARRQVEWDIAGSPFWRGYANQHVPHDEIVRRRAQPGPLVRCDDTLGQHHNHTDDGNGEAA